MSAKFPCQGCLRRNIDCHSTCRDYIEAKHKHSIEKAVEKSQHDLDMMSYEMTKRTAMCYDPLPKK